MENNVQKVVIENKSEIHISNVLEVLSFTEKEIRVKLSNLTVIRILGNNLKIIGFDNQSGNFKSKGDILQVNFKGKEEGLIKRVFK